MSHLVPLLGRTQRRHIQVAAIEHIGKEANRWEEQLYLGENPGKGQLSLVTFLAPDHNVNVYSDITSSCSPLIK